MHCTALCSVAYNFNAKVATTVGDTLCLGCRKVFEPFGGLKSAFTAARDGRSVDTQIEMARGEGLFTADPDYIAPTVGDIELVFIAFDILFMGDEVYQSLLKVICMGHIASQPCRHGMSQPMKTRSKPFECI